LREQDPKTVVGVAWYRSEQWSRLRDTAADPDALEDTHEEWRKLARKMVLDMAGRGIQAERVEIDVDELTAWCRERKRAPDASARAEFTTRKLRQIREETGA